MKPKQDAWTIVIVGCWNRMIFMPTWVSENLFGVSEIEKLVPIAPIAPLIYRTGDVSLQVEDQRLIFQARQATPDCLTTVENMAVKALDKLPVTPVSGIGVNFSFVETSPDDTLLKLFNIEDGVEIGSLGWDIKACDLARRLQHEDQILNLKLSYDSGNVEVSANFHRDVAKAAEAADVIENKVVGLYETFTKLIAEVYKLRVHEETQS